MKSLALGVVVILVLGIGGFVFRHVVETTGGPQVTACTLDAKICPDGSAVGRVGPSCEFAPCAFPNAVDTGINVAFVVPDGYTADAGPIGPDETLRAVFEKPSLSENVPHNISIRAFPIPSGETSDGVILAHTRFQPADMQAESFERFETLLINGKEYRHVVIERFEAQVQSAYFLVRENDVLMFEIVERDVTGWMDADLTVRDLPEHTALETLLSTLQSP